MPIAGHIITRTFRSGLPFANDGRPRILLAIDRPGWAFDNIALQMQRHLTEFDFLIVPYPDVIAGHCEVVVAFWWASLPMLRQNVKVRHSVLCVYDAYAWRPDISADGSRRLDWALAVADAVAVGNEGIARLLDGRKRVPTFVVEDGVDTSLFTPRPLPAVLTAGWTGNSRGTRSATGVEDLKGTAIIRDACAQACVPLRILDRVNGPIPHMDMPEWYAGLSVYLCASSCEGTPNPILEAMACGRPVVTTDVGLVRRIVAHGVNGYVVERTPCAIAAGLRDLAAKSQTDLEAMGAAARRAAEAHSWHLKMPYWRNCLAAIV